MKAEWQSRQLGDVADVIAGQSPDGSFYNRSGDGLPFYQGKKDFGDRHINAPTVWTTQITKVAREGDVLMSVRAPVGPVNFATEDCCIGRGLAAVRSRHGLDRHFLFYYLLSKKDEICGTEGAVFASIDRGGIKRIPIAVPDIAEQQRIVSILDQALEAVATAKANTEESRRNARVLFGSYRCATASQGGEGWIEKPLNEVCEIKHGFAFKGEFFAREGEYVVLTPGNFNESGGYRDRGEKQKYYSADVPHDYVLAKGDLLVAMTEQAAGLLGSPILVPESEKFLHNQRLGLVRKKAGVPWVNEFFFHVFNTDHVRTAIHASASGVKVRHTSPTKIGDVLVRFPSSETEQRNVVAKLDSLASETQRLESIYQRKLVALDELKKSLLHRAFAGEL